MSQPEITLTVGATTLTLDPDLRWIDEFSWHSIDQSIDRSLTGALIIDQGEKDESGRPITLAPPDDSSAWMPRSVISQLATWEADPAAVLTLNLRGVSYQVVFRRHDAEPIEAVPTVFVADPIPDGIGDWYLVTLRLMVYA